MARERYVARQYSVQVGQPFGSAEEAWLWFARCQTARDEGVRYVAGLAEIPRPCEPDDIAREVRRLHRSRRLDGAHVRVLCRFGGSLVAPQPAANASRAEAKLWEEALDRLALPLKSKGIVA
jgi:hypothetical protein